MVVKKFRDDSEEKIQMNCAGDKCEALVLRTGLGAFFETNFKVGKRVPEVIQYFKKQIFTMKVVQ